MPATARMPSTARPTTANLRILPPGGMSMGTGVGSDQWNTAATGKLPGSGISYPSPTELNLGSGTSWRACGESKRAPAQGRPRVYVGTVWQLSLARDVQSSVHAIPRTRTGRRTALSVGPIRRDVAASTGRCADAPGADPLDAVEQLPVCPQHGF